MAWTMRMTQSTAMSTVSRVAWNSVRKVFLTAETMMRSISFGFSKASVPLAAMVSMIWPKAVKKTSRRASAVMPMASARGLMSGSLKSEKDSEIPSLIPSRIHFRGLNLRMSLTMGEFRILLTKRSIAFS